METSDALIEQKKLKPTKLSIAASAILITSTFPVLVLILVRIGPYLANDLFFLL